MVWVIYNFLLLIGLILGIPFFLFQMATHRRFRIGLGERFTLYGRQKRNLRAGKSIWIQAASVGEVSASIPLLRLLKVEFPDYKLILTCLTASGRRVAREKLKDVTVAVLGPLDLGLLVIRLICLISPRLLILVETEIWPGLITVCWKQKIPIIMTSGRISPASFKGYMKATFLVKPLLRKITVFNMRTEEDAHRIKKMGAPPEKVFVTGNIKFDSLPDRGMIPEIKYKLAEQLGLKMEDMIIVGGSTFAGEEIILYNTFRALSPDFPNLRLILAPRHLERVGEIEEFLRSQGQAYSRLTDLLDGDGAEKAKVIILDKMGMLFDLYSLATVVFIGRSLKGRGGQNPIEPASLGKPILFGPHMENFRDIAEDLSRSGGAIRLADESELKGSLIDILSHPEKGRFMGEQASRVVESRRGASRRNLETIKQILEQGNM